MAHIIGRADDCDIRVDDEYASPHHARVWRDENGVWIQDLGSTNGTWIALPGQSRYSGTRVYGPTPLLPGIVVWVGRTSIPWTAGE